MKVDIREKLNLRKLEITIEQYSNSINFSDVTYLIMNNNTMLELERASGCDRQKYTRSNFSLYRGIKIAVCEVLKFGEIDIR